MSLELKTLVSGFRFTESPRWHEGRLWFVDVLAQQLLSMNGEGDGLQVRAHVPGAPGGLGFMPDGTPIVVSANDFRLMTVAPDGRLSLHADLSHLARGACNDMLIDGHGRAYVGHYGYDVMGGAEAQAASLLMVAPDGTVSEVVDDLRFPNGMAIGDDGDTLIVAETFANQLTAFDVEADGALTCRRIWAPLPGLSPDGICMDAAGAIWVGCAHAGQFVRVEKGGTITHRVATPGRWAVACALGGVEEDRLFCMTAETSFERFAHGKSSAFVEIVLLGGGSDVASGEMIKII